MTGAGPDRTGYPRQHIGFLLLYALAWAGGAIAYVPLLTLLLPLRLTAISGTADIEWLAYATFAGALTASLANIAFGWLSDVTGYRRGWIATGLAITLFSYAPISQLSAPLPLILALVGWQIGLNMMLAPLGAWAADTVPNSQRGLLGGLLAFAPATGALAGVFITIPGLAPADGRIGLVAVLVAASVLPLLLLGRPVALDPATETQPEALEVQPAARRAILFMWIARLSIQTSEAALFAYLLFLFRAVDPNFRDADVARIFSLVLLVSVPIALLAGRWADQTGRPVTPLTASAGLAATGLAVMAAAGGMAQALTGYVLFGLGATVFLALHTSQTMRVLPRPSRRGRDLGLFNLTNTLPSLLVPVLTLAIVPAFGYGPLMWLLAGLALVACLLLASLKHL